MNLKVLHIANDYSGSNVYKNLCLSLDKLPVDQFIYTAIRSDNLRDKNLVQFRNESEIFYRKVLNLFTRVDYFGKISKCVKDLIEVVEVQKCDLIHAHTWFSDGGVAYELKKRFGKPYIVTVRNTDLNIFFKYFIHLRRYGRDILENSEKIIFISPVYLDRLLSKGLFLRNLKILRDKSLIIPNGVDDFWIENVILHKKRFPAKPPQLVYVGNFKPGKNVFRLMKAVEHLNKTGLKCTLHLIGGDQSNFSRLLKAMTCPDAFINHGILSDKGRIKEIFRTCDIFTMPSKGETFGLVYVEALSQGLPIIYTKNEGIDGYYENVGEAVNANSTESISENIKKVYSNYSNYNFSPSTIVNNHNWEVIGETYFEIYHTCKRVVSPNSQH